MDGFTCLNDPNIQNLRYLPYMQIGPLRIYMQIMQYANIDLSKEYTVLANFWPPVI